MAGVLERAEFILGSEVAAFEQEFAAACDAEHAIAVNSGTSALHLALLAANVGPGDEVITVPFSFVATVAAIRYTGATPVFTDIERHSFNIDPDLVERAITPRTKAIMPVHLFGHPADMDPILEVAQRHGLVVIEDAAQAHLAEYKGRRVGSLGDFAAFSFYPGKNLGAFGEGGLLIARSSADAQTVRKLRDWGATRRYCHELKGFNYRMDGLQGAVLRVKLRHLPSWTEARRRNAHAYRTLLDASVSLPMEAPYAKHVYNVFAIRVEDRDQIQQELSKAGIATSVNYPLGIHQQPAHADLGYTEGSFPIAEAAAREQLSLPIYPELRPDQIEYVANTLKAVSYRR